MNDVKVTVTEIDSGEAIRREDEGADSGIWYGEGELTCQGPGCSNVIGFYLGSDYDNPDLDRGAFNTYWEIETEYPAGPKMVERVSDVVRFCEDDWAWLEAVAPAIVAFNTPTERSI
jgi:hypothetical protein